MDLWPLLLRIRSILHRSVSLRSNSTRILFTRARLASTLSMPVRRKWLALEQAVSYPQLTVFSSFHNYQQYLANWTDRVDAGNAEDALERRPLPTALLHDNTTVLGRWINVENMTELSSKYGQRIINNVSMAMPHSGVFAAARDPLNRIMQPMTLDVRTPQLELPYVRL